jgi:hypothetical protein
MLFSREESSWKLKLTIYPHKVPNWHLNIRPLYHVRISDAVLRCYHRALETSGCHETAETRARRAAVRYQHKWYVTHSTASSALICELISGFFVVFV